METIEINEKVVVVPSEVIIDYLKYRKYKINSTLRYEDSEYAWDSAQDYIANINNWIYSTDKLENASFDEVAEELEKVVRDLLV